MQRYRCLRDIQMISPRGCVKGSEALASSLTWVIICSDFRGIERARVFIKVARAIGNG